MAVKQLDILYDDTCGLCLRCAAWLKTEPAYVKLRPISRNSETARRLYGSLIERVGDDEMVIIADDGSVYRGDKAYLMCLWATRRWRSLAMRLSKPAMRSVVRSACHLITRSRHTVSCLFALGDDETIADKLRQINPPRCAKDNHPN